MIKYQYLDFYRQLINIKKTAKYKKSGFCKNSTLDYTWFNRIRQSRMQNIYYIDFSENKCYRKQKSRQVNKRSSKSNKINIYRLYNYTFVS